MKIFCRLISACAAVALLSSCMLFTGGKKHELTKGRTFFTKVNMWYTRKGEIASTNYHVDDMLPAGTQVRVTKCRGTKIDFETGSGNQYTLEHVKRHSRIRLEQLFDRHFGENDPTAPGGLYGDLTPRERENVRKGTIATGMSRDGVVMAYGYPPGHRTPNLDMARWTYWVGRRTMTVHFKDDRVVRIEGVDDVTAVKLYAVSDPPGAMIRVDGVAVGSAPCIVELDVRPPDMARTKVFHASPARLEAPRLGVLCDAPAGSGSAVSDPITVREVIPLSNGNRLGLVPGDRILAVNGTRIRNETECMNVIRRAGFGQPLRMLIRRGSAELTLSGRTDRQESGTFHEQQQVFEVPALVEMNGKVVFFDLRKEQSAAPAIVARPPPAVEPKRTVATSRVGASLPDLPLAATGFVVTRDGHIMTCASPLTKVATIVVRSADGGKYSASMVHMDQVNDWCLLKAPGLRAAPVPVGGGTGTTTGAKIYRLGYAAGEERGPLDVADGRVTSPQGFGGDPRHMQVKITGGAEGVSGAPVVNARGEWVAVASDRLDKIIHAFAGMTGAGADVKFLLKARTVSGLLPAGISLPAGAGRPELDDAGIRKRLSGSIVTVHAK